MRVRLLSHTPEIERLVYTAARTCYSSSTPSELWENPKSNTSELIKKIIKSGHHSVLEHIVFSFEVAGISRAASHQLVRHRLASYSQQSQRYVVLNDRSSYVVPPRIAEKQELQKKFEQIMEQIFKWYNEFTEAGIPPEDARFILPAGVCTNLVVTMNARELFHFFSLRCCRRAQWEIRAVAWEMLKCVRKIAPTIFEKAGPDCITPKGCQEGNNSCGSPYTPQEVNTLLAPSP